MSNSSNAKGGHHSPHYLIGLHEPPDSLVALRQELMFHPDICEYAMLGANFEECMGRIALKLDIALDGEYEVYSLCEVLVESLRNKRMHPKAPHLRHAALIDVELVEKEGTVELYNRNREEELPLPANDVIVTETNH